MGVQLCLKTPRSLSSLSTALIDNPTTKLGNASVPETYSPLTHSREEAATSVLQQVCTVQKSIFTKGKKQLSRDVDSCLEYEYM